MTEPGADLSVVIPTYNGLDLLTETLPSVLEALRRYREQSRAASEVIVVDDGGSDETARKLPQLFPDIRLVQRSRNGGFSRSCNSGFSECRYPLVGLLNNDVKIQPDFFLHKATHFAEPDVFGVTARIFEWGEPVFATGGKLGRFRRGFWSLYLNYDLDQAAGRDRIDRRQLLSSYAVGGFATFRKSMLDQLGGFCELLSPFHWEDIDLSYRAWKRGWIVRYEPRSVGWHRTSATIDAHYRQREVDRAALRNRLLFHWINLHSTRFWLQHLGMVSVLAATRFLVGDLDFYRALRSAWNCRREVVRLRGREKKAACRSDPELARIWQNIESGEATEIYYNRADVEARHPDAARKPSP